MPYRGLVPTVPMFPLNTVLFPGARLALHVFEERYRALMRDVLAQREASERVFGVVAIREGYEVGEHGVQSSYRVGALAQITDHVRNPDGTYDVEVTGRERIRLESMHTGAEYFIGEVSVLKPAPAALSAHAPSAERARRRYEEYVALVDEIRGVATLPQGPLPLDAEFLSYAIAARCVLPLPERQELLEASDAQTRLELLHRRLGEEMRAIRALPSLPATELARTHWSPN